jgi:hypothetical protein
MAKDDCSGQVRIVWWVYVKPLRWNSAPINFILLKTVGIVFFFCKPSQNEWFHNLKKELTVKQV